MSPVSRREDVETKLKEEIECKQLLARHENHHLFLFIACLVVCVTIADF